jgi:hypothetical protein
MWIGVSRGGSVLHFAALAPQERYGRHGSTNKATPLLRRWPSIGIAPAARQAHSQPAKRRLSAFALGAPGGRSSS